MTSFLPPRPRTLEFAGSVHRPRPPVSAVGAGAVSARVLRIHRGEPPRPAASAVPKAGLCLSRSRSRRGARRAGRTGRALSEKPSHGFDAARAHRLQHFHQQRRGLAAPARHHRSGVRERARARSVRAHARGERSVLPATRRGGSPSAGLVSIDIDVETMHFAGDVIFRTLFSEPMSERGRARDFHRLRAFPAHSLRAFLYRADGPADLRAAVLVARASATPPRSGGH